MGRRRKVTLLWSDMPVIGFVLLLAYYFLYNFFSRTEYVSSLSSALNILRYLALFVFLISIIRAVIHDRTSRRFIGIFLSLTVIVLFLNRFLFPEITQFSSTISTFFSTVIQMALLVYLVDDIEKLIRHLRIFSILAAILLLFFLFVQGIDFNSGKYSMALGYICLLPAVILFYTYFQNRKFIDLLGAITISITIVSFGSRGPLLCLGLFIVFVFLKNAKPQYIILATCGVFLFYIFYNPIMSTVLQSFSSSSTSRTLQLILSGQMSEDTGRYEKYIAVINEIKKNPLMIRGINADYLLIGQYTHNLFLELLYEFGVLFGGLICVDIVYRVVVTIKHSAESVETEFCFMFVCISIPQLMVSHSLWAEWSFWAWYLLYLKNYRHGLLTVISKAVAKRHKR